MLFIRRSVNYGTLLKNNKITTLFTRQGRIATTLSNLYFSSSKPAEKMKFKAETKKLLNIVAKSLYTDSQVFLKQLLSNASDSLQKQRFISQTNDGLVVNIEISSTKNQLIIQDNGIGMSRQDLINNLGTIAKSGSKQFLQKMKNQSRKIQKNIIGQFGVGFYSSFIVADHVQVISKMAGQPANKWSSDGDGTFKIQQVEQPNFERGTKIILHIKPQHKKYLDKVTIQKIIQNYSQFINYPIFINKEAINLIKALWAREKKDISDKQYQDFYQFLTEKTNKYQYKMHFSSDTPLHIKSLLFIPQNHSQTFDKEEKKEISLYCKKVLIQKNCKQLLPNFLRFVKGVVDCEDIPLNISRQKYQDSALMNKLKDFLTKKVLKSLKDQADKDPITYNKWYSEFELFIKQGSFNNQYRKQVYPLNRYGLNTLDGQFSLKDYISLKKPEQDRIFYFCAKNKYQAKDSLYVNPLTQAGIPVVIAYNNIDQIIFINMDTYEGLKFSNVETDTQSVQKILQLYRNKETQSIQNSKKVKQEQFVQFSNWIKQELQPFVNKVNISKRGIKMPAMVFSPISSSLRQIQFIQRLKQNQKFEQSPQIFQNLTLQYDPSNPIMIKLNNLRKSNQEKASLILQQIFDNSCIQAGLQINFNKMANRLNVMMAKFIEDEFKKNL